MKNNKVYSRRRSEHAVLSSQMPYLIPDYAGLINQKNLGIAMSAP